MKVKRPYYIGHPKMLREATTDSGMWAKPTLADVIEQARERVQTTGEDQIIVKVIKVVRRQVAPIVVEDVR